MTLLEHLNNGGCIRFNQETKKIVLVKDSQDVSDTIPCTEKDIWTLLQDNIAQLHVDSRVQADLSLGRPELVLTRADVAVQITQRDREVFAFLLDHWDESNPGLPGRMSYQDVYDLAAKLQVPEPHRTTQRLAKAEELAAKYREHHGAT